MKYALLPIQPGIATRFRRLNSEQSRQAGKRVTFTETLAALLDLDIRERELAVFGFSGNHDNHDTTGVDHA